MEIFKFFVESYLDILIQLFGSVAALDSILCIPFVFLFMVNIVNVLKSILRALIW